MIETAWFFIRCLGFAALCAFLLILVSCRAQADPLADLGVLCIQGNAGACSLYQSAVSQQQFQQQQYQRGIDSALNYLTQQQYLANQRMQRTPNHPTVCTQQGVFTICQ